MIAKHIPSELTFWSFKVLHIPLKVSTDYSHTGILHGYVSHVNEMYEVSISEKLSVSKNPY